MNTPLIQITGGAPKVLDEIIQLVRTLDQTKFGGRVAVAALDTYRHAVSSGSHISHCTLIGEQHFSLETEPLDEDDDA